ncbi:MAG: hypothetical protein HY046_05055 [Acidobacteria bacterium]|nr:hypothetical protein [Acidobacteriota bacterium]
MLGTGRANRCVTIGGVTSNAPDSDYSLKMDWNAWRNTNMNLRYQYSRQIRNSARIIFGDNFGAYNLRQYSIGYTLTHVFSSRQSGEFRFGFGNRISIQDPADGGITVPFPTVRWTQSIPVIRFTAANTLYSAAGSDTLPFSGTVIGTSTNVPINRRQHDKQYVYNHTIVLGRHTVRLGTDLRWQLLDDVSPDRGRGFWTFSTLDALGTLPTSLSPVTPAPAGTVRNPTAAAGFTGWENFLRGFDTGFQQGYGNAVALNRFSELNFYGQDDFRVSRRLTLNLGFRWEGVRAPKEITNAFNYGYSDDMNNFEPRIGFAYSPNIENSFLKLITGSGEGKFVIRGGVGLYHSRIFQSVFSQNQLSIRTQPPNGFAGVFDGLCSNEVSDPSCGFVFTPGTSSKSVAAACSLAAAGCGPAGTGTKVAGGQLLSTLLIPDQRLHLPYVEQWNLTVERQLPFNMALQVAYTGNHGVGVIFYNGLNQSKFPIVSPQVTADVGGGNFQPVVFDIACTSTASNALCTNGSLTTFSALTSTTATLAQKGIVISGGVPHGLISFSTLRLNERRPDNNFVRNVEVTNLGWSYYNAMTVKLTKRTTRGLTLGGFWTWSKSIDTGSEPTSTGVDQNAPAGENRPALSLRGLSNYQTKHRVVINYSYDLPWYRNQEGAAGRILGGWTVSGITTFQSGQPFTILSGYDVNMDGVGGDRPSISDSRFLFRTLTDGRAQSPCPTPNQVLCPDTNSQLLLPGNIFVPGQAANTAAVGGNNLVLTPGADGTGTIGRNTFFQQGMNNFDATVSKNIRITESISLQMKLEGYNVFNRVTFGLPARTVLSTTPLGRITSQRNPFNYVNSSRAYGSRMGQVAFRLIF